MSVQEHSKDQGMFPGVEETTIKIQSDDIIAFDDEEVVTSEGVKAIIENTDYTPGVELATYLSRPVLILSTTWTEAVPFNLNIFPWKLYFDDLRIRKKIDNYSLFAGNLKLKIMINASPFYYGCAIASYLPNPGFTPSTLANVATYDDDLMPLSQREHLYIYPQTNEGGELTLPFFYEKDYMRIVDANSFDGMGTLTLREIVSLQSANGVAGTGVSIQIYAWAEDVKITAPTVGLAIQSRDEYSYNGPISAPASAIAKVASALSNAPIIGRYMRASAAIAGTVSDIAAWFGFTKVPVISDTMPFKNTPFPGLASSEIAGPTEKLVLDPKNELSIDPRIVGLPPTDELMISHICQKESYLTTFDWLSIYAPNTHLFGARVMPEMIRANGVWRNAAPMAHIQHMFQYWRGDIIFRFKFICSKYHSGRVRITWDPEGDIANNTTALTSSTVAFTKIVDITSCTDVEVRVPYMQALPWLKTATTLQTEYFSSAPSYVRDPELDNGNITLRVFTQQTSPIVAAPVQVMVFVRGADNLEFAAPQDVPTNTTLYDLQSSDELSYIAQKIDVIPPREPDPNRFMVNMGERIVSLRQLLRRSTLTRISFLSSSTVNSKRLVKFARARFPLYYGYDPSGIDIAKGTLTPANNYLFNYVVTTPFNWLAPCFIGMRGSSEWNYNFEGPDVLGSIRAVRNKEIITTAEYKNTTPVIPTSSSTISRFTVANVKAGGGGASLTNQLTQTGLSVSLPMYNQYKMESTDPLVRTLGHARDGTTKSSIRVEAWTSPSAIGGNPGSMALHEYHNIGTDFTFLNFQNVPSMRVLALPIE